MTFYFDAVQTTEFQLTIVENQITSAGYTVAPICFDGTLIVPSFNSFYVNYLYRRC